MKTYNIRFPLTNDEFLKVLTNSFSAFLDSGTSRSTQKLKPLHGAIANDIALKIGEKYTISSQGYNNDKESSILGRYMNKNVDITISKEGKSIAGIAVKFIMQNYSQNSNNYFENMLGETANIRCNHLPYFQVFIILDRLPYYKKDKSISKWESFTSHNALKYIMLSKDDANVYYHTPNKTLIYTIHIPDNDNIKSLNDYMSYYKSLDAAVEISNTIDVEYGKSIILNDYVDFREKVYHTIFAL